MARGTFKRQTRDEARAQGARTYSGGLPDGERRCVTCDRAVTWQDTANGMRLRDAGTGDPHSCGADHGAGDAATAADVKTDGAPNTWDCVHTGGTAPCEHSGAWSAPTMADLLPLKRPDLRARYDAAFPTERAVSQRLTNGAMRDALVSGIPAPRPDAQTVTVEASATDTAADLAALIARIAAGSVDAAAVERIARTVAADLDETLRYDVVEAAAAAAREAAAAAGPRGIEVTRDGITIGKVDGATHAALPKVIAALSAGCHVFLVGPAGSGKTTLARQAAAALGLPFLGPSIGPDTRSARLVGYRSPTTGDVVRGILHDYATGGGCVLLDEMDTAHPSVLPELNALLANGHYVFGDGAEYAIHPDFRVIAGANTYGRGADAQYVGRSPIDAASIDRFAYVTVDYDRALEARLVGATPPTTTTTTARTYTPRALTQADRDQWTARVFAIRDAVSTTREKLVVSPRATINGLRLIAAGWSVAEAEDGVIWRGIAPETRARIESAAVRS